MRPIVDLTGKKFGRWTVIRRATEKAPIKWDCICDCGTRKTLIGSNLKSGDTSSCGCLMKELVSERMRTHGATIGGSTKEHKVWSGMKERAGDPKRKTYADVKVCDRWANSFDNFLADMGKAPSDKHQIDRIDNSKGYSPDNCRWATPKENTRNRTNNMMIEWNGERKCLAEWSEILNPVLGLTKRSLHSRFRLGWSVERAFTTPCDTSKSNKSHGTKQTPIAWRKPVPIPERLPQG